MARVQGFVGQCELGLFQGQAVDVGRIVIERAGIGPDGLAPARIGDLHRHAQHQRTEERPVKNQAGTGRA